MINRKGISLIALIITIAVIIILAAATIQNGLKRTDDAKISAHNQTISQLEEEVQNYYYFNGGELPAKKDALNNNLAYILQPGSGLETEINRHGDGGDKLYVIDMTKLGAKNDKQGTGVGDDIFIVTENRHDVYYVKGDTIKGITYHGRTTKNDLALTNQNFANPPKLSAGMTPVKWNGSAWVNADVNNINNDWYNYTKGINKWANVKLADGSMLVWIPRYTYKILTNEHNGGVGISGDIDVRFSIGTNDDVSKGYRIHPAFYWGGWSILANSPMIKQPGGTEITGIWVGKFESSAANGQQGVNGDRVSVIPNVSSWRDIKIRSAFDKSRDMQNINSGVYGISNDSNIMDTHMLKNSEWGAVAYISKYVMDTTEISINNSSSYLGGKGDYINNINLSTTGNIYGIYDMSGAAWEYVSAYLDNNNGVLSSNAGSLVSASAKYKDIFPVAGVDVQASNYNLTNEAYGHAFWETSNGIQNDGNGWFRDWSGFMETNKAFTMRGGLYNDDVLAGIFYFSSYDGDAYPSVSWRIGVVVP